MKKLLIFLLLIPYSLPLYSQTWSALGTGVNYNVYTMAVYNGNLYVGGVFTKAGSVSAQGIAMWNGSTWSVVGGGIKGQYNEVNAMCVYNGNLYVGGRFDSVGNAAANNIAMWNGTTWSAVDKGTNGPVYALCVYNNDLYAGGIFDTAGGNSVNSIVKYNGTSWADVGGGVTYPYVTGGEVEAMCVYNNNLFIGGHFDSAGNVAAESLAEWNGSTWTNIGNATQIYYGPGIVFSMGTYNGYLMIGGNIDSVNNCRNNGTAYWNGSTWASAPAYFGATFSFCQWGTNFYLGTSWPNLYQWNGLRWDSIGNPITGDTIMVNALCVYNGALYAGGQFHGVGGVPASNIAKCSGSLGFDEINNENNNVTLYPNPNNGSFQLGISNLQLGLSSTVEIYNMIGELIYSKQFSALNSQLSIDLPCKTAGVYLYRLLTENGGFVSEGKLIIEK